jgi:hypothetical protein
MRITINLDQALLDEAQRIPGLPARLALIRAGLNPLIARQRPRRLARLELDSPPGSSTR